ncbi:hypothetical protein F7018_05385 [Tenacibaculum aiptasiae]|uniref:Uncharacterized protein n=1 Tax=Tenacibaculum aiptasiae TaxID=426481 RepID=A0A7J5AS27_9FLAO|nr:hypothetical protein [Tenacibaculum aiptasiae]KAB1159743.1 hypothetical protein F7018_05385 [Tenacibaculum aiptasiae]
MKEKKQYQKGFCIICKNKTVSFEKGVICSLTNLLPDFDKECNKFEVDKKRITEKTDEFKKGIKLKYTKLENKKFWTDPDTSFYIERFSLKNNNRNLSKGGVNMKFYRNKFSILNHSLVFIGIFLMIVYGNIKHNHGWDLQSFNMIFLIVFSLIGIIYISYNYFNDEDYVISIHENYINLNGEKIYWNCILDYVIIEGKNEDKVILCTSLDGIKKIDMKRFDNSAFEIASIIEKNIKYFTT